MPDSFMPLSGVLEEHDFGGTYQKSKVSISEQW
jgi:hypothetical protein